MKIFGQIIRTAVNIVALPVAVVKDVVTLGGVATDHESYIKEKLQQIKDEASE